jgi:predicted amidohydrolase YtcJ
MIGGRSSVVGGQRGTMPDLLFHGGPIYTLDPRQPRAEALLVRGDRIVAVGSEADVRAASGGRYEDVPLNGRALVPGLIDAHIHILWTGLGRMNVDLEGVASLDAALEQIERHVRTLPEGAWVRGHGWNHALWNDRWPTAAELDRVTAGHPAVLSRKDGHSVWLNSAALARAGIDRDTVAPAGGTISRDGQGEPTGVLSENAMNLAYRVMPDPTWQERRVALRRIIAECNRRGLTGLHIPEGAETLALFRELYDQDDLTIRALWHIPYAQLDQAIALGLRSGIGDEWVRIGGVKIFSDGALGSVTCHMLAPFEGSTDNHGIPTIEEGELRDAVLRADRAGIAATIHAIGDRANRTVLHAIGNAIEQRARQDVPPTDVQWGPRLPHRIEHAQHLDAADVGRFAQLGVVASMQPIHATSDYLVAERLLGAARSAWSYAFRPLLEAGATLAFGSDAPVETIDPWAGIHAAVTRQRPNGQPHGGWHPEHRLTLAQALAAYTVGAAHASGEAALKGSLQAGMLADLVVTSADPFAADPQQLWQQGVDLTVVGGKVVE